MKADPTIPRSREWKAAREAEQRRRAELLDALDRQQNLRDRGGREEAAAPRPPGVKSWMDVMHPKKG